MFGGGSKKADCPLWKGPCKEHECRWYFQVLGSNPQTGQDVSKWDCAMALLPMLVIEGSQQSRQAGASADKVATEVMKFRDFVRGLVSPRLRQAEEETNGHLIGESRGDG